MGLWDVLKRESQQRSNTEVETAKPVRWIATNFDAEPLTRLFTENWVQMVGPTANDPQERTDRTLVLWRPGHCYIGSRLTLTRVKSGRFGAPSSRFTRSHARSANGAVISAERTSQRVISSIRLLVMHPEEFRTSFPKSPFSISSACRITLRVVWSSSPHSGSRIIPGLPADPCSPRPRSALVADTVTVSPASVQKSCHSVLRLSRGSHPRML
ncbi:hypothetical protein EV363DRAFT_669262 [Boletus edulis]|nr:hypothetical protein EV363DRAFT_669262 [Boletus edulis]